MSTMTFTEHFDSFVCEGDAITCVVNGLDVIARIHRDDCRDRPDERQDGSKACFRRPSLYKDAPGFIGPGNNFRARFAAAQAKAEAIMAAWEAGEWFYCGVVLSVECDGAMIEAHAASLWGVEANYPDTDNIYLQEVANDLLPEALAAAEARRAAICAALCGAETITQP